MKKISDYYYDETGLCPVCGEGLVPVTVYSGKVLNTHVSTKVQDINTKVRTTTKTYTDITPHYVGWCQECAKRAHEAREEAKAAKANKPKPILPILGALLLVTGVILMAISGPYGLRAAIGFFAAFVGFIWFLWALIAFLGKNRQHKQYATGWREPFAIPSEESLSRSAAYYMNKQHVRDREYLSIEQVKQMPHAMPF
ncbi:MAG: hypothetical protein IJS41_10015 [Clostridia bacterium]|nr:hypothetical protein [Clostridia bacterium]